MSTYSNPWLHCLRSRAAKLRRGLRLNAADVSRPVSGSKLEPHDLCGLARQQFHGARHRAAENQRRHPHGTRRARRRLDRASSRMGVEMALYGTAALEPSSASGWRPGCSRAAAHGSSGGDAFAPGHRSRCRWLDPSACGKSSISAPAAESPRPPRRDAQLPASESVPESPSRRGGLGQR